MPWTVAVAEAVELTGLDRVSLLRWRLILGPRAETAAGGALGGLLAPGDGQGVEGTALAGGGVPSKEPVTRLPAQALMGIDGALSFIYEGGLKGASLDPSAPYLPRDLARWLQDIRRFFPKDTVTLIQKDAIERRNLKALLFEPETLPLLERNVDLVATLLQFQHLIPDRARDIARQLVREIVEEIRKRLEPQVRQAVIGALRRNRHAPLPVYRNIDWRTTIRRNLRHYQAELQTIVPERFYFWANQVKFHDWHIIVAVDQSGSMGTSIIYSSIMGAIFASLSVLKTTLVFFDTEVADMTDQLGDPVDLIFGARLGGGTDIARAVAYAADQIETPEKTIFVLITDLCEGGDPHRLLQRLAELVEDRVRVLCLLALNDDGKASYDAHMAQAVAALGAPTFGCTPKKLVELIESILKGRT
jgi:hypothetical protein